jgi:hypothetical protein
MRAFLLLFLIAALGISAAPVAAQDADALRKELEQMRRQFDAMKQEYQKAIDSMAQRLQRLEAAPPPVATPPAAPTQPAVTQAPAQPGQTPGPPTLMDLARPRQPFSLYERRGAGQLLFDIGVVGDFTGNLVQRNVDKANAGTFAGRENRFFPREVELLLFGQIDPYARAEVRIEAGEEEAGAETGVGLAEANLTLLTLPWGTQLKIGQMRNRFGLMNQFHREALPQTDQPNVLTQFFGEEGLVEKGAELSWIPALPFYLEALVGLFDGDNETAFGRGSLKTPLATGRVRSFLELGNVGALQFGVSAASGKTGERRRQTIAGYDIKYKLIPDGWRHPLLTLAGEGLYSIRRVEVTGDPDEDGIETTERRTRNRFGWYAYGEVQPYRRWSAGVRYDSTQLLEASGREWAIGPYLNFFASDFLRFRLGYKHTERDRRDPFAANDASARIMDELFFQATFFLGAHPAHPF